jgi:hypothetical protein
MNRKMNSFWRVKKIKMQTVLEIPKSILMQMDLESSV